MQLNINLFLLYLFLKKKVDGQAKYGSAFKTYDYFVARHAIAQTDPRGDQAHYGPHFPTWHGVFVLEFENALLSVDPSIGGMPYWDVTISTPSVFTDEYFGVDPDASTDYQVVSGKFAHWPVNKYNHADWSDKLTDTQYVTYNGSTGTGYLRGANNGLNTPTVARYGNSAGVESRGGANGLKLCSSDPSHVDWMDWYECMETGYHSPAHAGIGGKLNGNGGDFEDPVTSPNAPIFMFHHSNMERSRMWWMAEQQAARCDYWNYPVSDATGIQMQNGAKFEGMNLGEPLSSGWGFTAADLSISEADAPTGLLTHADVLCWLNPSSAPFIYDTHLACESDPSLCKGEATATTAPGTTPSGDVMFCTGTDDRGM